MTARLELEEGVIIHHCQSPVLSLERRSDPKPVVWRVVVKLVFALAIAVEIVDGRYEFVDGRYEFVDGR